MRIEPESILTHQPMYHCYFSWIGPRNVLRIGECADYHIHALLFNFSRIWTRNVLMVGEHADHPSPTIPYPCFSYLLQRIWTWIFDLKTSMLNFWLPYHHHHKDPIKYIFLHFKELTFRFSHRHLVIDSLGFLSTFFPKLKCKIFRQVVGLVIALPLPLFFDFFVLKRTFAVDVSFCK